MRIREVCTLNIYHGFSSILYKVRKRQKNSLNLIQSLSWVKSYWVVFCCLFTNIIIIIGKKKIIIKQFLGSACKPCPATSRSSCAEVPLPRRRPSLRTSHQICSGSRTCSASRQPASGVGFPARTNCCSRRPGNSASFSGFRRPTGSRWMRSGFRPSFCWSVLRGGGLFEGRAARTRPSCRPRFLSRRLLSLA